MKREFLAGLILLAMAAGLYLHNISLEDTPTKPLSEVEPDFVARAMKTRSYGEDGKLNAEIAAEKMMHFQQQQLTEFSYPVYLVYPTKGNTIWKVKADYGQLRDNRMLNLRHNVVVEAIDPNEPISTIVTEHLALDLNSMVMTSEEPLRAYGEQFTMNAVGLWADLNINQVTLKQKVNATYEVQ